MKSKEDTVRASPSVDIVISCYIHSSSNFLSLIIRLVSVGNLETAVSILLSTPPESPYFSTNALRAVALSSAVSRSLLELAVKVVAANMVRIDKSLSGTHLLCAVGRYQEACSQVRHYTETKFSTFCNYLHS
ncbi:hypothetical protein CK203_076390 [Vitis vinifera]|uniref:WDR11 TPR domain-containing protein n=1 Tax=Vitis vinifera TaxID=29760 RepID=A0A438C0R5_VITVI|nr:hypothetical protein CK203_076390 [Vitis vinifera]